MKNNRTIEKTAAKVSLGEQKSDFAYWQRKSPLERLAALEEIRREYHKWKYDDAEPRFQRVYRIVKLK